MSEAGRRLELVLAAAVVVRIAAGQTVDLPPVTPPATPGDSFAFHGAPEPPGRVSWRVPGIPRKYFEELLPALFERTLILDGFSGDSSRLEWIFTGPAGGFSVELEPGRVRLVQRYYDSVGLRRAPAAQVRPPRHPEGLWEASSATFAGELRAVTVRLDHRLGLTLVLNGIDVLHQRCLLDVNRHQLAFSGQTGGAQGRLLRPAPEKAAVTVNPAVRKQRMLGFGGIATPTAYAQLSPEGRRQWWRKLVEYNLLLHREYPIGARLNPEMSNWDRLQDAVPHYYGDNFANGEISDFEYLRTVRRFGGKVIFEFWQLPEWARRDWRDVDGKSYSGVADVEPYVRAVVAYCRTLRDKAGAPPDIVGVQNEVTQPAAIWQEMALALRKGLDQAGFQKVKMHMQNASTLAGGIATARAFTEKKEVWNLIDYAAANMYDYQRHLYDLEGFDRLLVDFRRLTGTRPFISTEISVNNNEFQARSYRLALAVGQLYHKNLTLADAVAIMFCWTLLNVEQPSYGWTRSLMVPDAEHGFVPVASSHQLRVFGAYSRRIREGMTRLEATSSEKDLLAAAFEGADGSRTMVLLNRSLVRLAVTVSWPGQEFRQMEVASPQEENAVGPPPARRADGTVVVTVEPGAIVTLTNVKLGRLSPHQVASP